EKVPPSNKEAIARFLKAAAKNGIHAEVISPEGIQNIAHYDALFIRETTAIDHHTYRLACKAENHGLVVIDDPVSILRCCNKVFLHDAFSYQKVPSLRTKVVNGCSEQAIDDLENLFGYPLVLKMPEGSFSKGVFKVKNRRDLTEKLEELFRHSALVLAQEFLYTDFDWRIGVLNGRAIYACRYEMARNHWQIYNHDAKRFFSGGFETLPTFEVPKSVLDAALKAARIVGEGLYGVDVKEQDNKAYVLEVNDNPNIDHKVEDAYLGDELYMQIMSEFQRRLEARGR
ncbi:MAG: RimK family alpha-L-glutamate ligase, partial [Ketobacteraceae bacterium]|nr:RimK family alpha-L-glutamate ligase [Ketobacteraceae bacterium]